MKDRSGIAGYVVALEGLTLALARRQIAAMSAQERAAFAKDAAACVAQAGNELLEGAALMRHALTPDAAKAVARKIADDANHVLTEMLLELSPAAKS